MRNKIRAAAVVNHIVNWLKSYAENAKSEGFVIGVSGGIDSAVVSKLCAMTGMRTVCVVMPIAQKQDETIRARAHIRELTEAAENQGIDNIDFVSYDLTSVFEHYKLALNDTNAMYPRSNYPSLRDRKTVGVENLALANLRSRMRMNALYYLAGKHNLLVAGTGNKVEDFGVGFFTKYGDGGVDISPIADLYKTEVYDLAEVLGINKDIRDAAPTDGLWDDGRTDETQIGATYAELEWAMEYIQNNAHYTPEDLEKLTDRERDVLRIYKDRHNANRHKMDPIPVCEIRKDPKMFMLDKDDMEMLRQLSEIRQQKNVLVRSQKYEESAKLRDMEKQVMEKLRSKNVNYEIWI